jgi:hypothetical protein
MRRVPLEIASALEDQTGIPPIAHQAVLIEEIQSELEKMLRDAGVSEAGDIERARRPAKDLAASSALVT